MAIELGTAYVSVVGDTKRLSKDVKDALKDVGKGKGLEVPIAPKVDKKAAEKAGKETGEAVTKATEDAVRKSDIGKTVGDEITKSAKGASAGKETAKIIVDGIAEGVKQEMPRGGIGSVIVDGIAEGVKQGIDGEGIGGDIVNTISGGIKSGNLPGTIKDAVKGVGDELRTGAETWSKGIADSLRSGDIRGATSDIGAAVSKTTDLIADIGDTFGLQLDGVREFGTQATTHIGDVSTKVEDIITTADTLGTVMGTVLPGKVGAGAASMLKSLGPVAAAVIALNEAVDLLPEDAQDIAALNVPGVLPRVRDYDPDNTPWYKRDIITDTWNWLKDHGAISDGERLPDSNSGGAPSQRRPGQRQGETSVQPFTGGLFAGPGNPLAPTDTGGFAPGVGGGGRGWMNYAATSAAITDATLLSQVPSGSYAWGGADLATGLTDCTGAIEDLVNILDGRSTAGRSLGTDNAPGWLASRGFQPGTAPGAFNVGFNSTHMQATLPGGTPFNWGSDAAAANRGIGGTGAFDPAFTQHYFRYATGGGISGAGSGKSDSIPAMLSHGEHVLSASDVNAMGGQNAVYGFRSALHRASGGAVGKKLQDMRTEGYIPAAAGNMGKAGDSTIAKGIDMGGQVINGIIDQAASAAQTAVAAGIAGGTMGVGAAGGSQAGAAAAGAAIGLGTDAAKRGVTYGFDMLGIGADALLMNMMPFGMPRWLSTDPGAFMPNGAITGALKKVMSQGAAPSDGHTPGGFNMGTDQPTPAINGLADSTQPQFGLHGAANGTPPGPVWQNDANSMLSTEFSPPAQGNPTVAIGTVYTQNPDELSQQIVKRQNLAAMQYTGRPGP
jgi:hypothetical protein